MPADTRDRIIYAAMDLFARKGYGSTSVADILDEAGVNAGSLYHFFPGKQDVLLAVLSAYRQGLDEMLLQPAWEGVTDPIDRVFALLEHYRQYLVRTECAYGCPIGSIALELHEPDPPVRALLASNFHAWISAIEKCFTEAGGRLPSNVDRRGLAIFALTTMEGGVMLSRTERTLSAFDRSVQMLRDYVQRLQAAA
ncbi:MAG TPA: TetR/AcrR family transcriptional regulator [Gemmatimonadaceae bacterium]|nr:TetR/AcrR family transcriptional regulator [Gemmatimonadaceae bacterium]